MSKSLTVYDEDSVRIGVKYMTLLEYREKYLNKDLVPDYLIEIYISCKYLNRLGEPLNKSEFKRKYIAYWKQQNPSLFQNERKAKTKEWL